MPYAAPPAKNEVSATPSPTNAVANAGFGKLYDMIAGLLGATGFPAESLAALKLLDPQLALNLEPEFSAAANALTCELKGNGLVDLSAQNPGFIAQRSAVAGNGGLTLRKLEANVSLTVPAGAKLGHADGAAGLLFWYLLDNAGAAELAVSGRYQGLSGRYSTVAMSVNADSADAMYSENARVDFPGRLVNITLDAQAVAGTWTAVPTEIRKAPFGGEIAPPRGHIQGFVCANNAVDAANDIDIGAGELTDDAGYFRCVLTAGLTKRLDAGWAEGSGNGGLDAGVKAADTWYYLHLIREDDGGALDALFSTSFTAPTVPAGWTRMRCFFAVLTDGSSDIVAFHAYELAGGALLVKWDAPTLEIDLTNTLTTARRLDTVKVPTAFATIALLRVHVADSGQDQSTRICCPDEDDAVVSAGAAPMVTIITITEMGASGTAAEVHVRTSSAGQIASRATTTVDSYSVATVGFIWARR